MNKNIFYLPNIEIINLGHCSLSGFVDQNRPIDGEHRYVNIAVNLIYRLFDSFGIQAFPLNRKPKIKSIDLSFNRFSLLPTFFQDFKSLEYLSLAGNEFVDVPGVINKYNNLTELDVSENLLTNLNFLTSKSLKLKRINISGGSTPRHRDIASNDMKTVPKLLFEYIDGLEIIFKPGVLDPISSWDSEYGENDLIEMKKKRK